MNNKVPLYTAKELAERYGVTPNTMGTKLTKAEVPYTYLGMLSRVTYKGKPKINPRRYKLADVIKAIGYPKSKG